MGFENEFRKKITFDIGCGVETKDLILEVQKCCISECEEFEYQGVKTDKDDRKENDIKNRSNIGSLQQQQQC